MSENVALTTFSGGKYYNALDLTRFLCAFLVIAIHTQSADKMPFGAYFALMSVCSVAVPFFFACSGFFLCGKFTFDARGRLEKSRDHLRAMLAYEKRLAITYLIWSAAYFAIHAYQTVTDGEPWRAFVADFMHDLFLNGSEYHLWYVVCLIYAVPLLYLFLRYAGVKWLPVLMTVLFVIGQLKEGYGWLDVPFMQLLRIVQQTMEYGFMVFIRAIPFLSVGVLLRLRGSECGKKSCLLLAVLCFALGAAETLLIRRYFSSGVHLRYNMFLLGTTFFLFAFLVKFSTDSPKYNNICALLRGMSSFIYFAHPMIIRIFKMKLPGVTASPGTYYAVVAGSAALLAAAVVTASKKIKILKYTF